MEKPQKKTAPPKKSSSKLSQPLRDDVMMHSHKMSELSQTLRDYVMMHSHKMSRSSLTLGWRARRSKEISNKN